VIEKPWDSKKEDTSFTRSTSLNDDAI